MHDINFVKRSAALLALCTPEQRLKLAQDAQSHGKAGAAADIRRGVRSGARPFESPAAGLTFDQMFPTPEKR